jgi:hypothetical protein
MGHFRTLFFSKGITMLVNPAEIVAGYKRQNLLPARGHANIMSGRCCAIGLMIEDGQKPSNLDGHFLFGFVRGFDGVTCREDSIIATDAKLLDAYINGKAVREACVKEFGEF